MNDNYPTNAEMPYERWKSLMENHDLKLTSDELEQGWHFCWDWDGLLVGPGMMELKHCHCGSPRRSTTMSDELRAASERLWRIHRGEPAIDVYGFEPNINDRNDPYVLDIRLALGQWLAEQADKNRERSLATCPVCHGSGIVG